MRITYLEREKGLKLETQRVTNDSRLITHDALLSRPLKPSQSAVTKHSDNCITIPNPDIQTNEVMFYHGLANPAPSIPKSYTMYALWLAPWPLLDPKAQSLMVKATASLSSPAHYSPRFAATSVGDLVVVLNHYLQSTRRSGNSTRDPASHAEHPDADISRQCAAHVHGGNPRIDDPAILLPTGVYRVSRLGARMHELALWHPEALLGEDIPVRCRSAEGEFSAEADFEDRSRLYISPSLHLG
jgi:hypothetical protein